MSGVDRDIQCGNSFNKLYELGCFAEEFIVYGCSYFEKNQIYYMVSASPEKICQLVADAPIYNRLCSPIVKKGYQQRVASGTKEDIKQEIMLDMAMEMSDCYGKAYYAEQKQWIEKKANDLAQSLLNAMKDELAGCFEKPELLLFEGLCKEALRLKVLERHSYNEFDRWLQHLYQQMENDVIERDTFSRTFSGFAYEEKTGQLKYFYDANKINVLEKRDQLLHKGVFTTPVVVKEYNFSEMVQLASIRKQFASYLEAVLDKTYIATAKDIYQLSRSEVCN